MPKRPKIIIFVTRLETNEGMTKGRADDDADDGDREGLVDERAAGTSALLVHQNTFLPMSPLGRMSSTARKTIQAKNSATCGM